MLIQFSPIRSGSTLVFNILQFLGKKSNKEHDKYVFKNDNKYIVTIRHPYNSIISSIMRYDKEINIKNIKEQIRKYLEQGGNHIANKDLNSSNHCILIYEKFYNDLDYILDEFELFFNEKYEDDIRNEIKIKFSIENVKKITEKYNTFAEYDSLTNWHGKHISCYNGETDFNNLLNKEELNILKQNNTLTKIIDKFY
tara:strand:+ start:405 stop:995 length:591 start_codon:yes stop_codon:yes gene_type:complete